MMKKLLPFLCASALALSLTACAGTINNSTADAASDVTFTFTNSGVIAAGETNTGYEIDGTVLTITDSGTYTVSGSCADGSIKVKKGTTGVTLVLSDLTLTSEDTAAITCGKSSEVTILASAGTTNSLSDTEQNNDDNYPENENAENAVIKCKDGSTVTLCGDGELTVTANGKNGIKSGATTDEDGEALLTIRDLTLNIDAPVNDAINAEQLLNVESGTLTIDASDDAIHCDLVLNIGADGTDGPTINITNCCEGLEGAELNVCSGDITINASDDCLNAANSDLTDYDFTMTISGGTIDAYSSAGDGFDSNGDLTITGGTVIVWTDNTADNEPLDADGTITVSGGTVLAAGGSSGMGMNLEAAQPCVIYGSTGFGGMPGSTQSSLIAADADFTIEDADGNAVYSGTARCGANFFLFSSADVVADSAYTLKAGDSSTEGTAQSGTVSTGMGMGGGFPGGGQKPDGELPEGFDARSQSFPTGKCPKCPAASVPRRPAGREAPLTATPQRATVPPIPLQLPNGRDKEKQTARTGRLLFAVCSVLHRLKTDDHAAALGIVAAKTTAGADLNVCFGKVPAQRSGERPSRLRIFGVVDAHLAAVVVSFQKLLYHRRARLFFAAAFFNGLDRALKTCGGEDLNAENADGARGDFADAAVLRQIVQGLKTEEEVRGGKIFLRLFADHIEGEALGVQLCELLCEQLHLRSRAQRVKDVNFDLRMRLEIHVARGHGRGTGAGQAACDGNDENLIRALERLEPAVEAGAGRAGFAVVGREIVEQLVCVERFIVHEVALAGADGHGHALIGYALQHREVGRGVGDQFHHGEASKKIIGYSKTCCQVKSSLTTIQRFSITVNRFSENLLTFFSPKFKMMKTQFERRSSYGRKYAQPSGGVCPKLSYPAARGDPRRGAVSRTGDALCQSIHHGMRAQSHHGLDGQQLC